MKKIKGLWSIINNQDVIEILAQADNDFLIFDMEHGSMVILVKKISKVH